MRSMVKLVGAVVAMVAMLAMGGCGGDTTDDDSFGCTGGGVTLRCIASTQYCEQATNGSVATGAACRSIPAGCAGNPCNSCLMSGTGGIILCSTITLGDARATTVNVRSN